jgi:hypothetical protein
MYIPTHYIQNVASKVCTCGYANMCAMSDKLNVRTV